MKPKIYIKEFLEPFSPYDLEMSINDVIENFDGIKDKYMKEGFINIRIEETGDSDNCNFSIYGDRLETDEEYNARMKTAEKAKQYRKLAKQKQKEDELKQLEKLAKKHNKRLI